jgi:hypothetical protein
MKPTICKTRAEARTKAIDWQNWQSTQSLSWSELAEWGDYFRKLAWKFGLKKEFEENGVI